MQQLNPNKKGYISAYRNRLRCKLIRMLGGPDPVTTAFLVHKANLLASTIQCGTFNNSMRGVVEAQVKGIRRATIKLDPVYAAVRGYDQDSQ